MRESFQSFRVEPTPAMHLAMCLRGTQARFTDPTSGELVQPGSLTHSVGAFVMAAVRAGFKLADVVELSPDEAFAAEYPRAAKYIGWPMLVVLRLETCNDSARLHTPPKSKT